MTYVVTSRWVAKPGREEAVIEAVEKLLEPTRAEPDCLVYEAHRDLEEPNVFFFYERFTSKAAFEAHLASPHIRDPALREVIADLEGRRRSVYELLGDG